MIRTRTHGGKREFIIGAVRVDAEELEAVNVHSSDDDRRADVSLIPGTHTHSPCFLLQASNKQSDETLSLTMPLSPEQQLFELPCHRGDQRRTSCAERVQLDVRWHHLGGDVSIRCDARSATAGQSERDQNTTAERLDFTKACKEKWNPTPPQTASDYVSICEVKFEHAAPRSEYRTHRDSPGSDTVPWKTKSSHSLYFGCNVVDLHAVFISNDHVVCGPSVSTEDHSILKINNKKILNHDHNTITTLRVVFRRVSDLEYDPSDGGAGLPGFGSAVALLWQTGLQHCVSEKDSGMWETFTKVSWYWFSQTSTIFQLQIVSKSKLYQSRKAGDLKLSSEERWNRVDALMKENGGGFFKLQKYWTFCVMDLITIWYWCTFERFDVTQDMFRI